MGLLAAKLYDPTTAVSKSTAALLAMTALDTTNLRVTFTVPASGNVLVRIQGTVTGGSATPWWPSILLGVMEGATIRGRTAPGGLPQGVTAAVGTYLTVESQFVVPGMTAGASLTWDAAYGVETLATGSGLKYGGPNNSTTASDGFGAFVFEVWDPT